MKATRKHLIGGAAAAAFTATAAIAGYVQPAPVVVDLAGMLAYGDMLSARYADNKVEFIGCGVRKYLSGGGVVAYGFCQARNEKEEQIMCSTDNAELLDVIEASADYSFVLFGWNRDNECTRIGFSNQSFYLPPNVGSNL